MAGSFIRSPLPLRAYGSFPYQYMGTGTESPDIPLGLKYNQPKDPFMDAGSFDKSELAKDATTFLKQKTGKDVKIQPVGLSNLLGAASSLPGGNPEGLGGFYSGPQPGETSDQRTVFINQRNPVGLGTLFHETGHAVDPNLNAYDRQTFNPAYIQGLSKPEDRLNYFFNTTAWPHVVKETEAQRFAGESLNEFAQQQNANNGASFDPKTFTNNPNYKFYPGSYVDQATDRFFKAEFPRPLTLQQQLTPGSDTYYPISTGNATYEPNNAQKGLAFGLDKPLWQTQENIMQKTRDYIDPKLNQYMTNPTPAAKNYWSAE
jgi:hypothetical protein